MKFVHVPHQHVIERIIPKKVHEHHGAGLNSWLALHITQLVGTMWCAYLFVVLALFGIPAALEGPKEFVAWASSQFIQLVLLPIIIVGQNIQAKASDERSEAEYRDIEALLHEIKEVQRHLDEQDKKLEAQ